MFRFSSRLFVKVKHTTGLVGIPVQPRWREMIITLCDRVLHDVQTIPENTLYRTSTENNFRFFKKVVQENDDFETVEKIINRGQVEELIMMCEDELTLIPKLAEWKPWEVTEEDLQYEKQIMEDGEDYSVPDDYVDPGHATPRTWSGIYNVTYTPEELKALDEQAAQQAAEQSQQTKPPQ